MVSPGLIQWSGAINTPPVRKRDLEKGTSGDRGEIQNGRASRDEVTISNYSCVRCLKLSFNGVECTLEFVYFFGLFVAHDDVFIPYLV